MTFNYTKIIKNNVGNQYKDRYKEVYEINKNTYH